MQAGCGKMVYGMATARVCMRMGVCMRVIGSKESVEGQRGSEYACVYMRMYVCMLYV